MRNIDRRKFMKSTAGILSLAALDLAKGANAQEQPPAGEPPAAPRGANERLNVAVIGLGSRGSGSHINPYNARANCQITYLCDPDTAQARRAQGNVPGAQFVQDMRRVFDDRSVDVVSIATCNHWHSLAAIWAMQAGKDVYVEKPLSHNIHEGRMVVETMNRTHRICQVGTQMRSNQAIIEATEYLRSGALGRVLISRALCYKSRNSIGHVDGPQQPPATCDYNLWCGPAPMDPLTRRALHYDWHWVWSTGNGDIGNQGIHEVDLARWWSLSEAMPRSVLCVGGRFGYVDDGTTANTQFALYDMGENHAKIIVEVRGLRTPAYRNGGVENVAHCENGYVVSPSYSSAIAYDRDGTVLRRFNGGNDSNHFTNFIQAVRSRNVNDLHAPPLQGHLSAVIMHMANISYRLGQPASLATNVDNVFGNDADGNEGMSRMVQHLRSNNIDLANTSYVLGKRLNFDPQNETFVNDEDANRMRTRQYRAPFVVPERA